MTPVDNYQISYCLRVTIYGGNLERHISEGFHLMMSGLEGPLFLHYTQVLHCMSNTPSFSIQPLYMAPCADLLQSKPTDINGFRL